MKFKKNNIMEIQVTTTKQTKVSNRWITTETATKENKTTENKTLNN